MALSPSFWFTQSGPTTTEIAPAMWEGDTSKWTLSGNDASKTEPSSPHFSNIRIKHATAPVLDGDFTWTYTQVGNMGGNTDSSYGFYDISEDSTWASQAYQQGLNLMTSSYWIDTTGGSGGGATTGVIETNQGGSIQTAGISFSTNQTFKWQRTGTSLKFFIANVEKQEFTSVSATLRFCASGFTPDAANIADITCVT